jgi:hypothetical protein
VESPNTPTSMRRLSEMASGSQIDDNLIEAFRESTIGDRAVTQSPGAATQGSTSKGPSSPPRLESGGSLGLAAKLRAKTAQNRNGETAGPPRRDLFQTMIDIVEGGDDIDITNVHYERKEESRDYLAKQVI